MEALYQFGISLIQIIQNSLSPALDGVMNGFSFLGRIEFYLVLIPFIYWSIDRRIGIRAFLILAYTDLTAASLKLLFHEPRPYWIGNVKPLSTEPTYGIPSSHASDSLAIGGYLMARIKQNWQRILLGIIVFFVAFSRLYLGVHFPQDILLGWIIGFAVLWAAAKWETIVRNWLDDKSLAVQIGLGFIDSVLIFLTGLFIRFLVSGTADPASWSSFTTYSRSITHFFTLAGAVFGAYAGYALMRRYARFDAKGSWESRGIRYLVGIISLLVVFYGLDKFFALIAPDETALGYTLRYIRYGFATFWMTFLAPWLFLKLKLAKPE
ncbi:MAG: phosphatase PAP2 family protein [Anaerolineales bacterium]|nr:phosphatase PAP2 family protein [Anaerolineales bacterium]